MAQSDAKLAFTLGYSGGAVPDLHRSSLFVGVKQTLADHQRTYRRAV